MKIIFDDDEEKEIFISYLKKQIEFDYLCGLTCYGQADNTKEFLLMVATAIKDQLINHAIYEMNK